MSPFLKFQSAARRAGSFTLQLLGLPDILAPKIPPERMELATRIKGIEPKPSPFLEAISQRPYTPEELLCDPYPAAQRASMEPLSEGPPVRELKAPFVLSNLTHDEHTKRLAAVRTLERLGYAHRGGVEWAPPLGKRVIGTPESVAAVLASGDEMRDAIAFTISDHNPDGLEWLRAWDEGDPTAARELEEWRTREREADRQRKGWRNLDCRACGHHVTLTRLEKPDALDCPNCGMPLPVPA
jgi:hypothetical protein